jgi:UDP-MurNAc hydroxylase
MKVTFISQASLLIRTSDCTILTDPWYMGTAFNDAWKLLPASAWDNSMLDQVDHLWISHEHPDHFHIPTLKSFPQAFKDRVTLLFQKNNTDKMPNAFRKLGFKNIRLLDNRKIYPLTADTRVYVSQIGQMDSSLAVMNKGCTLLNLNDCEANAIDCKNFLKDLGKVDYVFNQFSMAGYNGFYDYENHLPGTAQTIINNMIENHRDLGAKYSIPFASNLYFCTEDNKYMNDFGNTPGKVYDRFHKENLGMIVLFAGETLDTDHPEAHDTIQSIARYDDMYAHGEKIIDTPPLIQLDKISEALKKRSDQLHSKFPRWILKKLQPVIIRIPDLGKTVELCLYTGELKEIDKSAEFDLEIYSQPLHFSFETTWGLQTMGVGARFRIKSKHGVWKWYRIVTSLNNAEMYLKLKYLFTKDNIAFVRARMQGGLNQLFYQLKRMET